MTHYKEEWKNKANIDYYMHFLALWVGFNSWYIDKYSEFNLSKEREYIHKVKNEIISPRNDLYEHFTSIIQAETGNKERIQFITNLESLYICLEQSNLEYNDKRLTNRKISFKNVQHEKKWINLLEDFEKDEESINLDTISIVYPKETFFACIIEIIYQIRCILVHGSINPDDTNNYDVIKYCYLILFALMK